MASAMVNMSLLAVIFATGCMLHLKRKRSGEAYASYP